MKKKLFLVALMAALSTVGYAAGSPEEQIEALNGKVTTIETNVGQLEQNLTQGLDGLRGEVGGVKAEVFEKIESNQKDQLAKDEAQDKEIANKADKNYVDGELGRIEGSLTDEIAGVRGEVGSVKAEVFEKIESNQKDQLAKDKTQDSQISANSQAIETNKNAITETNKKVEANSQAITSNSNRIDNLEDKYDQVNGRVSGLEKRVDHLDEKMNKGLSLMSAMNAVDFQNVQAGEMAIGAGIGHYGNAQSVALGVAYSPVEDLTVNAKYSVTAGDIDSFALGAGATYKFRIDR